MIFYIGSTAQETDISPPSNIAFWDESQLRLTISAHLSTFNMSNLTDTVMYFYSDYTTTEKRYTTLCTDIRQTCIANTLTSLAKELNDIYRYVVTYEPSSVRTDISHPAKLVPVRLSFIFYSPLLFLQSRKLSKYKMIFPWDII